MKKLFTYMMVCGVIMTAVLGFTSCEDKLDVQQAYPFTVETMPVPKCVEYKSIQGNHLISCISKIIVFFLPLFKLFLVFL